MVIAGILTQMTMTTLVILLLEPRLLCSYRTTQKLPYSFKHPMRLTEASAGWPQSAEVLHLMRSLWTLVPHRRLQHHCHRLCCSVPLVLHSHLDPAHASLSCCLHHPLQFQQHQALGSLCRHRWLVPSFPARRRLSQHSTKPAYHKPSTAPLPAWPSACGHVWPGREAYSAAEHRS